jgi:hypothetical protein
LSAPASQRSSQSRRHAWYFSKACASAPASCHASSAGSAVASAGRIGANTGAASRAGSASSRHSRQRSAAASPTASVAGTFASSSSRTNSPGARKRRFAAMPWRSARLFCSQRFIPGCGIRIVSGARSEAAGIGRASSAASTPARIAGSLPW